MDTSKIIKGVVNSGRYTVTAPIVKEDYGLYLQIEGVELPSTYEVDFSNSEHSGTSVTMIGNSDGVLIPSQFISSGKDVFAFLYHVGADFGRTVYKFRIPNKVRPDRTDEQPTPEEQSVIDQTISALNSAVAQTAQDVIDADASAQSASGSAEQAESARDTAGEYANDAESSAASASTSASQASTSATASAQSASQSAQIKADVEGMVDDAHGYASASAQSASASANSASDARGYANSASASAQSASGYASSAQTSAQTASAKASEASTSASTASQKVTEAAQSATNASQSAQTAESAKTASQTAQGLAESARDSAVSAKTDAESAKADAESARDEAQTIVDGISGALDDKAPVITDTASGSIASFSDGADDLPLKSLVIDINPIQDLHGQDAPYPPGGGVNILDPEVAQSGAAFGGVTISNNGEYIMLSGTATLSGGRTYLRCKTITLKAGTYYVALKDLTGTAPQFVGQKVDGSTFTVITDRSNTSFTLTEDTSFSLGFNIMNGTTYNTSFHAMIVSGSTAPAAWSPYENICPISGWTEVNVNHSDADMTNPTTLTINLGQTVYGGKLDVLSGELVIDRAMVDLGTLNWGYTGEIFYSASAPLFGANGTALIGNAARNVCEIYKYDTVTINNPVNGRFFVTNTQEIPVLRVSDNRFTDAVSLKSALDGIKAVFELYAPLTIQLTPQQVNSLLGVNNLWADSGDTEVEYRADTKLFIERLTAPDSADMIADSNITSGQYFMVGNSLYKATANIANGGQITVGTNCTKVSLAQALNEINA